MATATLTSERTRAAVSIPHGIPTVEYPPEVVDRWAKISEIAEMKSDCGELKTFADFAAERGYKYG